MKKIRRLHILSHEKGHDRSLDFTKFSERKHIRRDNFEKDQRNTGGKRNEEKISRNFLFCLYMLAKSTIGIILHYFTVRI